MERSSLSEPSRGDIWLLDLSPTRGHEQSGRRPALVVSVNLFNQGQPPEGGLKETSFVKCEEVRCVSKDRLLKRWGGVTHDTMSAVKDRLRILLDL